MPTTRPIPPETQRQMDEVIRLCLDSVTIAEKCCSVPLHGDAEQWIRFLNLCRDCSDTRTCCARLTARKCGDACRRMSRQGDGHAYTDLKKKETAKGGFTSV